jgi:hypothetical protein
MVAVGLGGTGRARLEIDCDQRQQERQEVGEIVSGLGEQGQRMSADAGHDQQRNVGQSDRERDLQNPRGAARAMRVHMHFLSLRGRRAGIKPGTGEGKETVLETRGEMVNI